MNQFDEELICNPFTGLEFLLDAGFCEAPPSDNFNTNISYDDFL
jgi:hypothetical protein